MNPESSRERLLAAAARLLEEVGFAGTTTRRVAEEAGLSEVTLFRQFGTKERLLAEAVRAHGAEPPGVALPAEPREPEAELAAWCSAHLERLARARGVLRRCLGAQDQLPLVDIPAEVGVEQAAVELRSYVAALRRAGLLAAPPERDAVAVTMLVSTIVMDALGRGDFPGLFERHPSESAAEYAAAFVAALGTVSNGGRRSQRGPSAGVPGTSPGSAAK